MNSRKVSIIVAVYNIEKYLKQCLDSLINQTLKNIEIICVNDGSTDNSLAILQEYASKDNRIIIINQKNSGPGVARNNAINAATGEYIMIVDPDDWLDLNACELAYKKISENKNDIVFFNLKRFFENSGEISIDTKKLEPFADVINNPEINLSQIPNYYVYGYTWSQIYSRNFIINNNIKYSDTYLFEDTPFISKAFILANTVSILDAPIYNYRIRKNSLSSSLNKYWNDIITNRKAILKFIQSHDNEMVHIYPFIINLIPSSMFWYKQMSKYAPRYKKLYYCEMRALFLELDKKYDINKISSYINYKKFKAICKKSWGQFLLEELSRKIFQLTNEDTHKVITILGIKIKLQRKNKERN